MKENKTKGKFPFIRKAVIKDAPQIQALINHFASLNLMLPRSLNDIYENIRDFWVAEENAKVIACCALHICWDDLAEIRSLAVEKKKQGQGIARALMLACLEEAKRMGTKKIFVLTYKEGFFAKFGFRRVPSRKLPHKIWVDCINCPKFPSCEEVAMIKCL